MVAQTKMRLRKGDTVVILSGKDRDRRGKILRVLPKDGKVVVEGLNLAKKHSRPTKTSPQGGVIDIPMPLSASKVMLICPGCSKPTRISRDTIGNEPVRACKHCGRTID